MTAGYLFQLVAFAVCAFVSIAGAIGMTTTMSMFRSGIFLMASFIGVAGLFILLAADLMSLLQIMMYIGGMLVMILFMVLFMHDPGGAMMATMDDMMSPVERFFSRGLQQDAPAGDVDEDDRDKENGDDEGMHDMEDMDMSMVTPVRRVAAWLAAMTALVLLALVLFEPSWPLASTRPDPHSAERVGSLLMGKYMIAFEGAGLLILLGIVGAVLLAHVAPQGADDGRMARVAEDEAPAPVDPETHAEHEGAQGDSPARHAHHSHRGRE